MEEVEVEGLVERAAAGEPAAWRRLCDAVEPWLVRTVGSPRFLGRIGQREDDCSNIVREVLARLHEDGQQRLKQYVAIRGQNQHLRFKTWLRIVAKRVGIDYLRGDIDQVSVQSERGSATELLRLAATTLPVPQLEALELWVQSASYEEIARTLKLASVQHAKSFVRAAIEQLGTGIEEETDE